MPHPTEPPRDDASRRSGAHPGSVHYPVAPPSKSGHLPPLRPRYGRGESAQDPGPDQASPQRSGRIPRKLTVTRVAALRSRELTERGIASFQRAAKADGADRSGLTALTYATMANFAADSAIAVALANTLFFSAAEAESKLKVALYLAITVAPFAVIAPLIGPALDRLQRGRRVALATSLGLRALLAFVVTQNYDVPWVLYPAALCMMVLSKSFTVLRSAVTPRVLPPSIDLVRVNSRLTVFGLVGTIVAGALAALAALISQAAFQSQVGALWVAIVFAIGGAWLSMRIPAWVEVTEGEVPASLTYREGHTDPTAPLSQTVRRQPLGRTVVTGLWGNSTIRLLTGFLTLYLAFYAKGESSDFSAQALLLGICGAAAGIGTVLGNAAGARVPLAKPAQVILQCAAGVTGAALFAALIGEFYGAVAAVFVASAASALAKVCLDASIQDDLPPESVASAFGRSETVLQLSWVTGGALGVLLPTELWIGFTSATGLVALGLGQTVLSHLGRSVIPGFGGNRPEHSAPTA